MSRTLDDSAKFSDEDRRWLLDRGEYIRVQENDRQFRPDEVGEVTSSVAQTGLLGTEPSATADRTEPGGIGEAGIAANANLQQRLAGQGQGDAVPDDDDLDTMDKESLKDEAEKRGLSKAGNKQELIDRIREHDASEE